MLSNIKNNYYLNEYDDLYNDIFKELLLLIIIINGYYEDQYDVISEIFNFLLEISEALILSLDDNNFDDKMSKIVKEVFYLAFIDKDEIKSKFSDYSNTNFSFNIMYYLNSSLNLVSGFSVYKNTSILEFLLDLFEFVGGVKNIILFL